MKKRYMLLAITLLMGIGAWGCGMDGKSNAESGSDIEMVSSKKDENEYDTINNVSYKYKTDWNFANEINGTRVYYSNSRKESFSITVVNESGGDKSSVISTYGVSINNKFGDNNVNNLELIGDLNWNIYSYTTDNIIDDELCIKIYLYTNGDTTVYVEYLYPDENSPSSSFKKLLESISIDNSDKIMRLEADISNAQVIASSILNTLNDESARQDAPTIATPASISSLDAHRNFSYVLEGYLPDVFTMQIRSQRDINGNVLGSVDYLVTVDRMANKVEVYIGDTEHMAYPDVSPLLKEKTE